MAKLRQLRRCVLLSLALPGCGQLTRGGASAFAAGVGGTSSASAAGAASARAGEGGGAGTNGAGGAGPTLGGTSTAGAPARGHSVCENEIIVGPGATQEVELGFVGTFDGQATELLATTEPPGVPTFSFFRLGEHLEAVFLRFSMTGAPGVLNAQISVANCSLNGQLLIPNGDGFTYLTIETGWLRSTTVTPDWETGTATGNLHFEIVDDTGSERHVLDGRFVWPAAMPDAHI